MTSRFEGLFFGIPNFPILYWRPELSNLILRQLFVFLRCDARPLPSSVCHLRFFVGFKLVQKHLSKGVHRAILFLHFPDLSRKYSPGVQFGQLVERSRRVEVGRGEDKAGDAFPPPCSRSMGGWRPEDMNWEIRNEGKEG